MNERIAELYKEAEKSVAFLSNSKESKQLIIQEKFAELIVKECIDITNDQYFAYEAVEELQKLLD